MFDKSRFQYKDDCEQANMSFQLFKWASELNSEVKDEEVEPISKPASSMIFFMTNEVSGIVPASA